VQIPSLDAGDMKNVTVRGNATPAGEHDITVIIDPEDIILESDESNNELTRTLIIQGADLTVSDMRITANGTETVIVVGDVVNIGAIVTNIGLVPCQQWNGICRIRVGSVQSRRSHHNRDRGPEE